MARRTKRNPMALAIDYGNESDLRNLLIEASARFVADLRREHGRPPADVALPETDVPARIQFPTSGYCGSPAALCME